MRNKARRASGTGSTFWSDAQDRYVAEVYLGQDKDGVKVKKRIVGSRGDKSDDAKLGLRDRLEQLQRRQPVPRRGHRRVVSRITLAEYLTEWLAARAPGNRLQSKNGLTHRQRLSDAAFAAYTWAVDKHIIPHLGTVQVRDLDRDALLDFLDRLNLSDASKEKIVTTLQGALHDAMVRKEPLITTNPAMRLAFERRSRTKKTKAWDKEQALRFLRVARTTRYYAMLLLMAICGLGPAETFALKWKNIDRTNGEIEIVGNLTEVGGVAIPKETKEKDRERIVVLPPLILNALKELYRKVKPLPSDYVFTAPEGGHMRLSNFRSRVWPKLLEKAAVPRITIYGQRHCATSIMEALGIPIIYISRILGHANIRTTDRYSHMFLDTQREVAAKQNEFLKGL
jgi:integrase